MTCGRRQPTGLTCVDPCCRGGRTPQSFLGRLPLGCEEGGRAHLGNLLVLQRPGVLRKGRPRVVLWSPSVLASPSSWGEGAAERPPFCLGKKVAPSLPLFLFAPSVPPPPLSQELPRFSYFILQCPIQKSFQRPQPCQRGARTKGLFDFLFVFICRWRGRGQERKSCWVLKFLFGLLHSQRGRSLELLSELGAQRQGAAFWGQGWSGKWGLPPKCKEEYMWGRLGYSH